MYQKKLGDKKDARPTKILLQLNQRLHTEHHLYSCASTVKSNPCGDGFDPDSIQKDFEKAAINQVRKMGNRVLFGMRPKWFANVEWANSL